jgi:hypothetical protein
MTDHHAGTGKASLENALSHLKKGDRVFITFDDYAQYHSHDGEEPNEPDDLGKLALANLALAYGCVAKVEDAEGRIYFSK